MHCKNCKHWDPQSLSTTFISPCVRLHEWMHPWYLDSKVKGQFSMRVLKSIFHNQATTFSRWKQHISDHTHSYTYSTIIVVVMWAFFPTPMIQLLVIISLLRVTCNIWRCFEWLLSWLVGCSSRRDHKSSDVCFCVKVYCVAQFCSPFPGNGRESERNGTERVTIKTFFLKITLKNMVRERQMGDPLLYSPPSARPWLNQLIFIGLFRKTNGESGSPMIHVHVRESEWL